MGDILIIKTGASGDVLRTTPLLRVFDSVSWITSTYNLDLLPQPGSFLNAKASIDDLPATILNHQYDWVISLEESPEAANLASQLSTKKLTGVYQTPAGEIAYSADSAQWFDMSLLSAYGKQKANELKKQNRKSYQQLLFEMTGIAFHGEQYILPWESDLKVSSQSPIGIEKRVGRQWPNKQWVGYAQLEELLTIAGHTTISFQQRPTIQDYISDICKCKLVVTGDTLAMHIALAAGIPCIALFNCTSPHEIYDYQLLTKVVSPLLDEVFYQTEEITAAIQAIKIDEVLNAVDDALRRINY
ncbi:MAG: hypothetical protein H7Y31_07530 [Chitinophagaceae bacterium]|nr:hypothetical protein [Chitinophagaceae bacterium]